MAYACKNKQKYTYLFFLCTVGMDEVSLISYLKKNQYLAMVVFPSESDRCIVASEVLDLVAAFEDKEKSEDTKRTAEFFTQYVKELESRPDGKPKSSLNYTLHFIGSKGGTARSQWSKGEGI